MLKSLRWPLLTTATSLLSPSAFAPPSSPLFPVLLQRQELLAALPLHFPPSLPVPKSSPCPSPPLVLTLSSLPGIPAKYFLLSISLVSWKKPRRQRHLLLYFARKSVFHRPCAAGPALQGELRTREKCRGAAEQDTSLLPFRFCADYGFSRSPPSRRGLGRGSCLGCGGILCAPILTDNYRTSVTP